MTKAELVAQIAKESGITKKRAETALKSLIEAVGRSSKRRPDQAHSSAPLG